MAAVWFALSVAAVHNPVPGAGLPTSRERPPRLANVPSGLLEVVNDWHFAMMNDVERNEAFESAIGEAVGGKTVLDLGAGGGLLTMMAAKHGAAHVYAIEANKPLVRVMSDVLRRNEITSSQVTVVEKMSTATTTDDIGGVAGVLVSETLGTFLLGESALYYITDARRRLATPTAAVIPHSGTQYVTAITSEKLSMLTRVRPYGGFNLDDFNILQDTNEVVFTKYYGAHLTAMDVVEVSPRLPVFAVNFAEDEPGSLPVHKILRFTALCTCTVHAVMYDWEAWLDSSRKYSISTHMNHSNFARDTAWGQAIQLIEDSDGSTVPKPFDVRAGEKLEIHLSQVETPTKIAARLRRSADEL